MSEKAKALVAGDVKLFIEKDGTYSPIPDFGFHKKLPPGTYTVSLNQMTGEWYFKPMETVHDSIVDLPTPAYHKVVKELEFFMNPETRKAFETEGFVYKRSTLLYGPPGTGKTIISNRIANKVKEIGGVVLFNPHPAYLSSIFKMMDSIQPETLLMIAFEEFDSLLKKQEVESLLLSLLDGQIQRNNIVIVATTNYVDRIPPRIRRPGRFSTIIEVGLPNAEERRFFLNAKMKLNRNNINEMVEKTDGFTVDELKELIVSHNCLKQPLVEVIDRIRKTKGNRNLILPAGTSVNGEVFAEASAEASEYDEETVDFEE